MNTKVLQFNPARMIKKSTPGAAVGYHASFYADWLSTSCEAERSERAKGKASKRKYCNPPPFYIQFCQNILASLNRAVISSNSHSLIRNTLADIRRPGRCPEHIHRSTDYRSLSIPILPFYPYRIPDPS